MSRTSSLQGIPLLSNLATRSDPPLNGRENLSMMRFRAVHEDCGAHSLASLPKESPPNVRKSPLGRKKTDRKETNSEVLGAEHLQLEQEII